MKHKLKQIIPILILLIFSSVNAQETINADNPNNFVTGGGQEFSGSTIELLPIAIIDIEGFTGFNAGVNTGELEAGLPVAGGNSDLSNIWLNFTFRDSNSGDARIYVQTNMPIPVGVNINLEIENNNYGSAGDFEKKEKGNINISENRREIVGKFKNGYTGDGVGNGYHVVYFIDNPNGVSFPEGFEIIYTIEEK